MFKVVALVLFAELWNTAGHIIYKKGVNQLEIPNLYSLSSSAGLIATFVCRPAVWLGVGCMTISLVIWLVALAQGELSYVYPLGSVQYVFTLLASWIFLREKLDFMKCLGTGLVVAGIVVIAIS